MATGVNSVLSMGVGALFASQTNIQVTGNNISNVNTPGYSRQAVVLNERYALNYVPGQIGQGVEAKEVIRYFDKFIEANYLNKLGTASRYNAEYSQLRYVENLFNESNVDGIAANLNSFFNSWNKLVQNPDDLPGREALLGQGGTLTDLLNSTDKALRDLEDQMNTLIRQEVASANQLMQEIAALNREISAAYLAGRNNPNQLMDERDARVRELGAILDVTIRDDGPGHYRLTMANGTVLVQDDVAFSLDMLGQRVENNLTTDSPYKGLNANGTQNTLRFDGADSREYTVEMVNNGTIGVDAQFRVSIDGGRTWLTDDDGNISLFNANEEANAVRVGKLDIHFDPGQVAEGDRFVISPKSDVYWIRPTSGPMNVSTQVLPDGSDNTLRITGGTLGGYLEFRDYRLGEYRDRLDAFTKSLIWEVNRLHSQGAGLETFNYMFGTEAAGNINAALGSPEARFTWAERLQSGNMTFAVYDAEGNPIVPDGGGLKVLSALPPNGNFDPALHSLQDVANAINDPLNEASQYMSAAIIDGKLQITALNDPVTGRPYSFAMTDDTTGLAAALGINTFFVGNSADSIAVRGELFTNLNLINAGRLDGQGQINPGDNQTAREIAALSTKKVSTGTVWNKNTSQTLAEYYGGLVTKVGADTQSVKFTASSETAMARDLYDRQEEISGVNLDEEMSNLIKFQASYKAAAKLITTADEMLQTLLGLKQ